MTPVASTLAPEALLAGLRTRLVSRLTGLSSAQLRYWHQSDLLVATLRSGSRGVPRLYSWVDYLRLRIASRLLEQGIPAHRIRVAVAFLDEHFPDWYLLPVRSYSGDIAIRTSTLDSPLLVRHRQHVLLWPDVLHDLKAATETALQEIEQEGPLGRLSRFGSHVAMDPRVNLGQPTLVGTALETSFVAEAVRAYGVDNVIALYRVEALAVQSAIEFEEAAA